MSEPAVVLASGSPRRAALLQSIGVQFAIEPPDVDETELTGEDPRDYVRRIAGEKASARARPGALVIAADTTVALDGAIVGKPADRAAARAMLFALAGRTHRVHTGVALAAGATIVDAVVDSDVTFTPISDAELDWYLATGEPDDKAGAYGLQGAGNVFVERIDGSPSNVMGLPLATVVSLARDLGVELLNRYRAR